MKKIGLFMILIALLMAVMPIAVGSEEEVEYCDPANKPGGIDIGGWVPKDVECVDFSFEEACGELTITLRDDVIGINYAVAVEEGSATYDLGNATFGSQSFDEDYNGGSVDLFLYIVGGEKDYVTDRDIPNFWEQNAVPVTVDTDCESDGTTTTTTEQVTTTTTQPTTTTTEQETTTTTVPEETTTTEATTSTTEQKVTTTTVKAEELPFTGFDPLLLLGAIGLLALGITTVYISKEV